MAAKSIIVPISDHAGNCTAYYIVEYKKNSEISYNVFKAFTDQVKIENVAEDETYNVRITRVCCNGGQSGALTLSVDTSSDSPQLDTPTGLALTPGSGQMACVCDPVTSADEYVFEIAQDPAFTIHFEQAVVSSPNKTFTELPSAILHYVRVKARASGFADSNYSATESDTTS